MGQCHDLAVPSEIIDMIPLGSDQEGVFTIASQPLALEQSRMAAEAQLQVFEVAEDVTAPKSALKVKITKPSGAHKQSTGSVVLVPDIKACNGLVNIVDSVIF